MVEIDYILGMCEYGGIRPYLLDLVGMVKMVRIDHISESSRYGRN